MGVTTWTAYGTLTTLMETSDLNALADEATFLSDAYDNSSNKSLFMDIEVYLTNPNFSAQDNPALNFWVLPQFDGTNYEGDSLDANVAPARQPDAIVPITLEDESSTGSFRAIFPRVQIPPANFKLMISNQCGAALPSETTHTVKIRAYGVTTA